MLYMAFIYRTKKADFCLVSFPSANQHEGVTSLNDSAMNTYYASENFEFLSAIGNKE